MLIFKILLLAIVSILAHATQPATDDETQEPELGEFPLNANGVVPFTLKSYRLNSSINDKLCSTLIDLCDSQHTAFAFYPPTHPISDIPRDSMRLLLRLEILSKLNSVEPDCPATLQQNSCYWLVKSAIKTHVFVYFAYAKYFFASFVDGNELFNQNIVWNSTIDCAQYTEFGRYSHLMQAAGSAMKAIDLVEKAIEYENFWTNDERIVLKYKVLESDFGQALKQKLNFCLDASRIAAQAQDDAIQKFKEQATKMKEMLFKLSRLEDSPDCVTPSDKEWLIRSRRTVLGHMNFLETHIWQRKKFSKFNYKVPARAKLNAVYQAQTIAHAQRHHNHSFSNDVKDSYFSVIELEPPEKHWNSYAFITWNPRDLLSSLNKLKNRLSAWDNHQIKKISCATEHTPPLQQIKITAKSDVLQLYEFEADLCPMKYKNSNEQRLLYQQEKNLKKY